MVGGIASRSQAEEKVQVYNIGDSMDKDIDCMAVLEFVANKLKGKDKETALKNIDKLKSIRANIKKNKEK